MDDGSGAAAAAGDEAADEAWFRSAYPALRRYAAVVAPSDLDADDLLQEAVARALRVGPLSRLDHPVAYLRRTMTAVAANHNRSRGRERRAHLRLAPEAGVAADYPSDLAELDRLAPADRAALYLADVEGAPLTEVAAALGISAVAARARVSRARRRLRTALAAADGAGLGGPPLRPGEILVEPLDLEPARSPDPAAPTDVTGPTDPTDPTEGAPS